MFASQENYEYYDMSETLVGKIWKVIDKHFENEVQWGFIKEKNVFLGHKINMVIYIYLKI